MIIPGYMYSPPMVAPGGAYAIRPYPAGRRAFGYPANLAGVPDAPRKVSKRAAERFRGLGNLKNAPLNVSEASEGSKHAAEGFRGVGAFFTNRIKNYHS